MSFLPVKFAPGFDAFANISHGFFGRRGGVSTDIYSSLNTGHGSDDDPAHIDENRKRVAAALGTSADKLLSNSQCHSTDVIIVQDASQYGECLPRADAMVTNIPGLALSALTADCAPVLFADLLVGVVGAAHAGWRGALAGVTDRTIDAMESLGAKRGNIIAAVGPCIGAKYFEVGPEFVADFISEDPQTENLFRPGNNDRSYFDMKSYLVRKLLAAGVGYASALPDCTYEQSEAYFSYRHNSHRNIADYGRNISAIIINE